MLFDYMYKKYDYAKIYFPLRILYNKKVSGVLSAYKKNFGPYVKKHDEMILAFENISQQFEDKIKKSKEFIEKLIE